MSAGASLIRRATAGDLALVTLAVCGVLLFGAHVMEHVFAMVPCPLCLMQRLWFYAAGLFVVAGLLHDPRWGIYPLLTLISAVIGGGFSIRQLYLQSLPPDQVPECGPGFGFMLEYFSLGEAITSAFTGSGECAEVDWTFLGLAMPAWTLIWYVVLMLITALSLRKK